jgi:lipoate-protein ligase B
MFCFEYHGQVAYPEAIKRQAAAAEWARLYSQKTILGMEHSPVITLGKRGLKVADILVNEKDLSELGISLVHSPRGGQATLHSPGQLVIYPVLPLKKLHFGAKAYIDFLTEVSENFLSSLGVLCYRSAHEPGLFTSNGKMVFFGVQITNGVSQHGLAINVTNDLSHFSLIRSCGINAQRMDRLQNYPVALDLEKLFALWCKEFKLTLDHRTHLSIDLNPTS